ncbi:biliverdin-producing heme oxygenase [Kribbella sp. CA-293567]|uniref:biliverdin-producing heme oxygenase n=1 Tax=Kribbella sp. CA-293567 TaxID=3002436 RepID=UPI0022DDB6A1|nr:biliverdin-producing heme oxygenase [Kribbella sp. CA-293567]WBQ03990.1 biliverdin-producing heme oxygenase [Kribbella sp. CA-293567]
MTPQSGPTATALPPFSARLRERSLRMHRDAEGSTYLAALTDGRLDLTAYAALVGQHAVIYQALEQLGDTFADDPIAGRFVFPELARRPQLEADLAFLRARGILPAAPTEATTRYAERLAELATWPAGFVAHHYVRYLGDLSGGQAIGRLIATAYGLVPGGDGVRFYVFDDVKAKPFKDEYRLLLDAMPLDEREQEEVLDEVLLAYKFNVEVLTSLAEQVLPQYPQVAS